MLRPRFNKKSQNMYHKWTVGCRMTSTVTLNNFVVNRSHKKTQKWNIRNSFQQFITQVIKLAEENENLRRKKSNCLVIKSGFPHGKFP